MSLQVTELPTIRSVQSHTPSMIRLVGGTTWICASPVTRPPSTLALIVDWPCPTAVTSPLADTTATLGLSVDQVTGLARTGSPPVSAGVAVS